MCWNHNNSIRLWNLGWIIGERRVYVGGRSCYTDKFALWQRKEAKTASDWGRENEGQVTEDTETKDLSSDDIRTQLEKDKNALYSNRQVHEQMY